MGMALLLDLLILVFFQLDRAWGLFILNVLIMIGILAVSLAQRGTQQKWVHFARDWYVIGLLLIIYLENRRLIPLINPHDIDWLLIEMDRFLFFGHHPTILMEKITWPALTEALQFVYASFYFLWLTMGA
jgi:hypothetical protein